MFIERLLPLARERLVTVMEDAPLSEAAGLLATRSDLVVVSSRAGLITRTDIVHHVAEHATAGADTAFTV